MNIAEQLEQLVEEQLCHECHKPLSEEEHENGYVCRGCIQEWIDQALEE